MITKVAATDATVPDVAMAELTRQFAEMLVHRRGEQDLEGWATRAEASPARELRDFVAGLRRDGAAAKAGLTLPCSSGAAEGNVNRIKMIKRDSRRNLIANSYADVRVVRSSRPM